MKSIRVRARHSLTVFVVTAQPRQIRHRGARTTFGVPFTMFHVPRSMFHVFQAKPGVGARVGAIFC